MMDEACTYYGESLEAEKILRDNLEYLPAGISIKGDLLLKDSPIVVLPPDLEIRGNLDLSGSNVTKLNNWLRIYGNLILSNSMITSLPENLFIEGNLVLNGSLITELPRYLSCYGEIDLAKSNVVRLADHLSVRCLSLANTKIKELPKYLTVQPAIYSEKLYDKPSFLDLKGSNITHIPDYAEISNLNLLDTQVTTYGQNVKIDNLILGVNALCGKFTDYTILKKNCLKLKNTNHPRDTWSIRVSSIVIEKDEIPVTNAIELNPQGDFVYADQALVGEIIIAGCAPHIPAGTHFDCSLLLLNSPLKNLPDDLLIEGSLIVVDSCLERLSSSIHVKESLIMQGGKVTCAFPPELNVRDLELRCTSQLKLPDSLFAAGFVLLEDCQIERLPENLEIGVHLVIRNNKIPLQAPDNANIKVGGSLFWKDAPFESWPENMLVCGGIYIAGASIRFLPDNFMVNGTLDLNGSKIVELPANLTVLGDLLIKNTSISSLPDSLIVVGKIEAEGTPLTPEQCESKSGKTLTEVFVPTWKIPGKNNAKYAWFELYDGCEVIVTKGERMQVRPFGQEKRIWIEQNEDGDWLGEYPFFKPEYLECGYES